EPRTAPRRGTESRGVLPRAAGCPPGLEPAQAREVLEVVATQELEQAARGDRAEVREHRSALFVPRLPAPDLVERRAAGVGELGEDVKRRMFFVASLAGEDVAVQRLEERMDLGEGAAQAHLVPVALDVAQVPHVLEHGKALAGAVLPACRL